MIDAAKEDFLNAFHKLYQLCQEVTNLGRLIKIYQSVALAKKKYGDLQYEYFFGFLQSGSCLLQLIVINSFKILDSSKGYIQSITKNLLSDDKLSKLFQYSKLQTHLNKLKKIITQTRDYRNKRYAHLEDAQLENFSYNLWDIYSHIPSF